MYTKIVVSDFYIIDIGEFKRKERGGMQRNRKGVLGISFAISLRALHTLRLKKVVRHSKS